MAHTPKTIAALVATFVACAWLGACTSAGRCRRGSEGCRATTSGQCDSGLVRDPNDSCVPGSSGSGGSGGSGGTGGTGGTGGSGGGPPPDACAADDLESACAIFCDAFCANQESLCVASSCVAGYCSPGGELYDMCLAECGTEGASCAARLCERELGRTCEDFAWRNDPADTTEPHKSLCFDQDPVCVHHDDDRCSDTCGSVSTPDGLGVGADLVGDGSCDDGSDGRSPLCPRGTDCTDCGLQACVASGGPCTTHEDCCGAVSPGAFCVDLGTPTCLASCTESRTCPSGFECTGVDNNVDFVCAPM